MKPSRPAQCPRCGWRAGERSPRTGVYERLISRVYVYPFRCQVCMYRFRAFRFGVRYSRQGDDRREFSRSATRLPAVASFHGKRSAAELTDISVSGGTIRSDLRPPAGALIQVEIQLPDGRGVLVDGAVVRSVREDSLGLEFTWVRAPERARLQAFLLDVSHWSEGDGHPPET